MLTINYKSSNTISIPTINNIVEVPTYLVPIIIFFDNYLLFNFFY